MELPRTRPLSMAIEAVEVSEIMVGERHRKDMGDLQALADSIHQLGLLQPIGITSDRRLVFGERRLRAVRDVLKRDVIACRIVDLPRIVDGEYHENEVRKDFTPSERVAIANAVKAEIGDRRGAPIGNDRAKKNRNGQLPTSVSRQATEPASLARAIAAEKAGFSSDTQFRRAKRVVEKGTDELVKAMDEGDITISRAAKIASLPKAEQSEAIAKSKEGVGDDDSTDAKSTPAEIKVQGVGVIRANEAINCLTRIPKDDPLRKRGFQIVMDWIKHNR